MADWGSTSGCITAGPKSVAWAMSTASLCRSTIAHATFKVVKRYCAPISGAISSTMPLPLPFCQQDTCCAVHAVHCLLLPGQPVN